MYLDSQTCTSLRRLGATDAAITSAIAVASEEVRSAIDVSQVAPDAASGFVDGVKEQVEGYVEALAAEKLFGLSQDAVLLQEVDLTNPPATPPEIVTLPTLKAALDVRDTVSDDHLTELRDEAVRAVEAVLGYPLFRAHARQTYQTDTGRYLQLSRRPIESLLEVKEVGSGDVLVVEMDAFRGRLVRGAGWPAAVEVTVIAGYVWGGETGAYSLPVPVLEAVKATFKFLSGFVRGKSVKAVGSGGESYGDVAGLLVPEPAADLLRPYAIERGIGDDQEKVLRERAKRARAWIQSLRRGEVLLRGLASRSAAGTSSLESFGTTLPNAISWMGDL